MDLLGVPAAARLPPITPEADPESGLAGLVAYAALLRARGYPPILEGSLRDTYGAYTRLAVSRGCALTEDFKLTAIRDITEAHQAGGHLTVWVYTSSPSTPAFPANVVDEAFDDHYRKAQTLAVIPSGSPDYMARILKRACGSHLEKATLALLEKTE